MNNIIKRGKLFKEIFPKKQLVDQFKVQKELYQCLDLKSALTYYKSQQQQINTHGKVIFLQYVNNFPLDYSYKYLHTSVRLYLQLPLIKNLTFYERQLVIASLGKLKSYICIDEKMILQRLIVEQEKIFVQIIKNKSVNFDVVHAINFFHLQKNEIKDEIYYECIETIRKTDYSILKSLFAKNASILLKRLVLKDWIIFRKFKHLLDYIVYDFKVTEQASVNTIHHTYLMIVNTQLHLLGYPKVPQFIDQSLTVFDKNLHDKSRITLKSLQQIFMSFDELPLGFNEKFFRAALKELKMRIQQGNQIFHLDKLPFKRLSNDEVQEIFDLYLSKNKIFDFMFYVAFNENVHRHMMSNKKFMEKLQIEFMAYNEQYYGMSQIASIIGLHFTLIRYYEQNELNPYHINKRFLHYYEQYQMKKRTKLLSLNSILHLVNMDTKLNLNYFNKNQSQFQDIFKQRIEKVYNYLTMIQQTLIHFVDSPNVLIPKLINLIILELQKNFKSISLPSFSNILFFLLKSHNYELYKYTIDQFLSMIRNEDMYMLIQMYSKFPKKSVKLISNIAKMITQKNLGFLSLAKLIIGNNFSSITSLRNELLKPIKELLEQYQLSINKNSLEELNIYQITNLLRFCRHFKKYIPSFSKKFLKLALEVAKQKDFQNQQIKNGLMFIEISCYLYEQLNISLEYRQKILELLSIIKVKNEKSTFVKLKDIEFKWLLEVKQNEDKIVIHTNDILEQLSLLNYSAKYVDIMINLLKLDVYSQIKLTEIMKKKLTLYILEALQNNQVRPNEIINHAVLYSNKKAFNQKESTHYCQILGKMLTNLEYRLNFDTYYEFLLIGKKFYHQDLLKVTFDKIFTQKLFPSQLIKTISILRFYPFVQFSKYSSKILVQSLKSKSNLLFYLSQILFTVVSNTPVLTAEQIEIVDKLFIQNEQYLLGQIHKLSLDSYVQSVSFRNFIYSRALKHIWLSSALKKENQNTKIFYDFLIKEDKCLQYYSKQKNLEGLSWELVYKIFKSRFRPDETNEKKGFYKLSHNKKQTTNKEKTIKNDESIKNQERINNIFNILSQKVYIKRQSQRRQLY